MAAGAMKGIGIFVEVLNSAVSVLDLASTNQATQPTDGSVTNVRIATGLNGPVPNDGPLIEAGGKIDVRFFNEHGEEIGSPQVDHYCNSGNTDCELTITMDNDHQGQQAVYGLFTGNDDAICIAYTTVAWADGSNYGWSGDWASSDNCQMGQTWYYSNVQMQTSTSKTYIPNCIWLDADGNQPATAFQVYYPDFLAHGNDPGQLCNNPTFSVYKGKDPTNSISYYDPPKDPNFRNGKAKFKRDPLTPDEEQNPANWAKGDPSLPAPNQSGPYKTGSAPQNQSANNSPPDLSGAIANTNKYTSAPKESRLVTSHHDHHLASDLCSHPYSIGPDFISMVEQLYCDMHTKTLYPLCDGSSAGNGTTVSSNSTSPVLSYKRDNAATGKSCYDAQSHSVVSGGPGRLAKRQAKQYSDHLVWGLGQ